MLEGKAARLGDLEGTPESPLVGISVFGVLVGMTMDRVGAFVVGAKETGLFIGPVAGSLVGSHVGLGFFAIMGSAVGPDTGVSVDGKALGLCGVPGK